MLKILPHHSLEWYSTLIIQYKGTSMSENTTYYLIIFSWFLLLYLFKLLKKNCKQKMETSILLNEVPCILLCLCLNIQGDSLGYKVTYHTLAMKKNFFN